MLIRLSFACFVISGCCCNCGPKKESYVSDVPATLKAAKALEKPPKVVVTVERVNKTRTGGGACGHSPICIVLLPVLLYEAAFPEKYDVVSVKEDGKEIFGATYTTDGDLIHGLKELGGGRKKEVLSLKLDALNKQVVVESAEISADGKRTEVPLQKQHDFLGDYAKAVEAQKDANKRGALLSEELKWLGAEAVPAVVARLKDPAEPDRSKMHVLQALCSVHGADSPPYEKELLAAAGAAPGPFTALAMLGCDDDDAARGKHIEAVVTGLCVEKKSSDFDDLDRAIFQWTYEKPQLVPNVSKAAKACSDDERRSLLLLELGEPVDVEGLTKVLAGPHVSNAESALDASKPVHREALFRAIATGANTLRLIQRLPREALKPNELEALAKAYVADQLFISRESVRRSVLDELHRRRTDCETAPARAVISAARDKAKPEEKPVFEVALVALGDESRREAAKAGLAKDASGETERIVKHGLELDAAAP